MHILSLIPKVLAAPVALAVVTAGYSAPASAQEMQEKSLYERLGGYDAIAAVSDDFIARLAADAELKRFLTGLSTDSQKRLRQLLVDQLCEVTGGPCVYIGRDMKTAHAGLGITESDWEGGVMHLVATLDKFSVPAREKEEVLAAVSALKADIVEM